MEQRRRGGWRRARLRPPRAKRARAARRRGRSLRRAARAGGSAAAALRLPGADRLVGERNENSVLFSLSALTATENAARAQGPGPSMRRFAGAGAAAGPNNGGRAGLDDIMNLGGGLSAGADARAAAAARAGHRGAASAAGHAADDEPGAVRVRDADVAADATAEEQDGAHRRHRPRRGRHRRRRGVLRDAALGERRDRDQRPGLRHGSGDRRTARADRRAAPRRRPPKRAAARPRPTPARRAARRARTRRSPTTRRPGTRRSPARCRATTPRRKRKRRSPRRRRRRLPRRRPRRKRRRPPGGGGEFNRGAATSALGAAAGAAHRCAKPDGPTGSGRVKVTFAPSGHVTSATIDGPPFAGTAGRRLHRRSVPRRAHPAVRRLAGQRDEVVQRELTNSLSSK